MTGPRADASGLLVGYLLLLFAIPAPLIVAPLGAPGSPAAILSAGLLVFWGLARILIPHRDPVSNPVKVALLVWFVAALLSYANGTLHGLDPVRMSGADRGILGLLGWLGIALVAVDLVTRVDRVLTVVVALTAVLAAVGVVQFFSGFDLAEWVTIPGLTPNQEPLSLIDTRAELRRVQATTSHPIELGVVVAVVIPLALHFALNARTGAGRVWAWVALGLLVFVVPLTISRSAIVGLAAALLVLVVSWGGLRRLVAFVAAPLLVLLLWAVLPGVLDTITALFVDFWSDDSVQGRVDDYADIGAYIAREPLLGAGFRTFVPSEFFILDNQFLGTLTEQGVLGLVALVVLLAVGIGTARGVLVRTDDPRVRSLATSLAASLVVFAVSFAAFDGLSFSVISGLLFLLLGLLGSLWRAHAAGRPRPAAPAPAAGHPATATAVAGPPAGSRSAGSPRGR